MTDKELLELAAKAAGYVVVNYIYHDDTYSALRWVEIDDNGFRDWNPLTDDGDALRLAVKLNIDLAWINDIDRSMRVQIQANNQEAFYVAEDADVEEDDDPYAATRRAIVRAAADIGKGME